MDEIDDMDFGEKQEPAKPHAKVGRKPHPKLDSITLPIAEPAIPTPGTDSEDADSDLTTLLGQPADSWTPSEKTYITEREAEILSQLGHANKGSARPLVDEVINCDIQMKRIDREIFQLKKKVKDLAQLTVGLKPLMQMRGEYMTRMTEAMENLGIMPKNYIQVDEDSKSMSEMHARYRAELDARRKVKWAVGTLSPEAHKLCVEVGSIPETYSSPRAMDDDQRIELIEKPETELPREK